jgi:hypothetical protein
MTMHSSVFDEDEETKHDPWCVPGVCQNSLNPLKPATNGKRVVSTLKRLFGCSASRKPKVSYIPSRVSASGYIYKTFYSRRVPEFFFWKDGASYTLMSSEEELITEYKSTKKTQARMMWIPPNTTPLTVESTSWDEEEGSRGTNSTESTSFGEDVVYRLSDPGTPSTTPSTLDFKWDEEEEPRGTNSTESTFFGEDIMHTLSDLGETFDKVGSEEESRGANSTESTLIGGEVDPMNELKTRKYYLSSVYTCLNFLTKDCIVQNRLGLEQLNALMQPTTPVEIFPAQATLISQALIYGGGEATPEGVLRQVFASLLCEKEDCGESLGQDFEAEDEDLDNKDCDHLWGRHGGALHLPAIKLLITCLEIIQVETRYKRNPIDFASQVWGSMFDTLVHNIRECHHDSAELTGYSVKCLRILHDLEPTTIGPIVKYTLFPFLISAQEYGRIQGGGMLEKECQELLQQSGAVAEQ